LDCQSNPIPSQIFDWQSKSKSNFQNGLTIQSNHNLTIFGKRYGIANIEWTIKFYDKTMKFPRDISYQAIQQSNPAIPWSSVNVITFDQAGVQASK